MKKGTKQLSRNRPKSANSASRKKPDAASRATTSRNLEQIAAEIRNASNGLLQSARTSLEHAQSMGRLLVEAKELVEYGQWGQWLDKHCGFLSRATIGAYMQVASASPEQLAKASADFQRTGNLTLTQVLKNLADPDRKKKTDSSSGGGRKSGSSTAASSSAGAGGARVEEAAECSCQGDNSDDASPGLADTVCATGPQQEHAAGNGRHPNETSRSESAATARDLCTCPTAASSPEPSPEHAPIVQDPDLDPNLADDDWLKMLPLYQKVGRSYEFAKDAVLWRRAKPAIELLRNVFSPDKQDLCRGGFRSSLAGVILAEHPSKWRFCKDCDGNGFGATKTWACADCQGAGYLIDYRVERHK